MVALPARAEIERLVKRYRRVITSPPSGEDSFVRYSSQAYHLYALLLKPVEPRLGTYTWLIIVPDGILHYLPFETLVTRPVNKPSARPSLLLSRHRLSYASSASVRDGLERAREKRDQPRMQLLAYAAPVLNTRAARAATTQPRVRFNGEGRLILDTSVRTLDRLKSIPLLPLAPSFCSS